MKTELGSTLESLIKSLLRCPDVLMNFLGGFVISSLCVLPEGQRLGRSQHLLLILQRSPFLTSGHCVPAGEAEN